MDKQNRIYIYAFLSRVFQDSLDEKFLKDLIENETLLEMIGEDSKEWFLNTPIEKIKEELNVDYSSVFLMNAKPIETSVIDSKDEILVGLQNPVMQFYFQNNYDLNLAATHIQTPDHISIELAFMQNSISRGEFKVQKEFLQKHLLNWSIPYFISIKEMLKTPLYKDLCDFSIEFLASDFEYVNSQI